MPALLAGHWRRPTKPWDSHAKQTIDHFTLTPLWLQGKPINQWVSIPNTSMGKMDFSAQIAAGLTNSARADIGYGSPVYGMVWGDSGGCLKKAGSILLLYGGGGAGAWAGNDIRGLTLEADAPRWATIKKPSSTQNLWHCQRAFGGAPSDPSAPYLRDGKTPNPGHSYLEPHFVDAQNKFYLFGRTAVQLALETMLAREGLDSRSA